MMPIEVTNDADFEKEVLRSEQAVLVDFYADWCAPCKAIAPIIDEIASEGKVKVVRINTATAPDIASRYRVFSIPTLIVFIKGSPADSVVGLVRKEQVQSWISKFVP